MNITNRVIGAWNHPGTCPTVSGDGLRATDEIIGFVVNGNTVNRGTGEYIYATDNGVESLAARTAALHGTSTVWTAVYPS